MRDGRMSPDVPQCLISHELTSAKVVKRPVASKGNVLVRQILKLLLADPEVVGKVLLSFFARGSYDKSHVQKI